MKKIGLLLTLFIGFLTVQCTPKYPIVIERPTYGLQNSQTLEIAKVELTDSATILHIDAYFHPGYWIKIVSDTYIQADGVKYLILHADGIDLDTEFFMPENGEYQFTLTFPALPKGTKSFDFIESDCNECFKIWDIDLTGKAKYKPELPSNLLVKKYTVDSFPEPEIKIGRTKVNLHIAGLRDGYHAGDFALRYTSLFLSQHKEASVEKISEEEYRFELDQYGSTQLYLANSSRVLCEFFANPGDEIDIYFDYTAWSKHNSRYNPEKEMKYVAFSGDLAQINSQIAEREREIFKYNKPFQFGDSTFLELSKEQYFEKAIEIYNENLSIIDNLDISPIQKQFTKIELNCGLIENVLSIEMMYNNSYYIKNRGSYESADIVFPTYEPNDILVLKGIDFNIPMLLYSLSFQQRVLAMTLNNSDENLVEVFGTDATLLFDMRNAIKVMAKADQMEELSEPDRALLNSTSQPDFYFELYNSILESNKKIVREAKAKGGFTIEKTPDAPNEKLLDAIMAKYNGKPVFVDFWATWCCPCIEAMETIKPIKQEFADKGVVSIYISGESSPQATWMNMLPEIGGIHYYLTEEQWKEVSTKYEINGIPCYMIFDKEGKKRFQQSGYPGNEAILNELSKVW